MKLYLMNTEVGLKPMYDSDFDEKKKLKLGKVYEAYIKTARNYEFHKKYMKLFRISWEILGEKTHSFFRSVENFRKTIEISAGHYEPVYSIERKEWIEQAKSIAFDKLTEEEFQELYERVKDVLWQIIDSKGLVTEENYNKYLRDF